MFHVFTLDGKQADLPLEKLRRDPRVNRVEKKYRARKYIETDIRGTGERVARYEVGEYRQASQAYERTERMDERKEPVFHAREIMTVPVITIEPDVTAADAWNRFNDAGVRNMPVVQENGPMIGILSERELLKKLIIRDGKVEEARDFTVRDIMSADVIATGPLTDIRRVAKAMLDQHVGLMPVVDEKGALVGVVTRSDILHAIIHHPGLSLWA